MVFIRNPKRVFCVVIENTVLARTCQYVYCIYHGWLKKLIEEHIRVLLEGTNGEFWGPEAAFFVLYTSE